MLISLAKALKVKNELAGQIKTLQEQIKKNNSLPEGKPRNFNVGTGMEDLEVLIGRITTLKAAIGLASQPILLAINRIAEVKAFITFLREIPTNEGTIKESSYREIVETKWTSVFRDIDIAKAVENSEKEISTLQDQIDVHNATTKIDF